MSRASGNYVHANTCNINTVNFNKPTMNIGKILNNTARNEEYLYENALNNNRLKFKAMQRSRRANRPSSFASPPPQATVDSP